MKIFKGEKHETNEQCVFEDAERQAVEYARCEMLLESLEYAIESGTLVILPRHAMGLTRKLVMQRMVAIEDEVRAAAPRQEPT